MSQLRGLTERITSLYRWLKYTWRKIKKKRHIPISNRNIKVSWVMEFLTCRYEISLISSKKWLGFKSIFCPQKVIVIIDQDILDCAYDEHKNSSFRMSQLRGLTEHIISLYCWLKYNKREKQNGLYTYINVIDFLTWRYKISLILLKKNNGLQISCSRRMRELTPG